MARSAQELLVVIDATTESLRRELKRADDAVNRSTSKMDKMLSRVDGSFKRLGSAVGKATGALTSLQAVLGAVGVAVFAKSVLDATKDLQRIESSLRFATGSAEGAKDAFDFVRAESDRLGLSLREAAQEFAALSAAANGTALEGQATRDIFTAVSEAATVMGLSADQTAGALNAIQQMISKGTVSAEELRGQLGERLPGAFQIAARAIGVTTQELGKMLQQGQLAAEDLLPALARELRKTFGPEVERASDNLQANMNRLNTAFFNLLAQESGLPAANEAIKTFTATIKDPSFQRGFDNFVAKLAKLANAGANLLKVFDPINELQDKLESLAGRRDALLNELRYQQMIGGSGSELSRKAEATLIAQINSVNQQMIELQRKIESVNTDALLPPNKVTAPKLPPPGLSDPAPTGGEFRPMDGFLGAVDEAHADKWLKVNEAVEKVNSSLGQTNEATLLVQNTAAQVGSTFASSFTAAITAGQGLRDMFEGLLADVTRLILRTLVLKAVQTGISAAFPGAGAFSPQFFPLPARAAGGPVTAGHPFLVGERGPEVFVPGRSGGIVPNHALGAAPVVNIINQGPPLQVERTQQRRGPDSRQVVDIMVGESFRRQLASGDFDADLATNMGVRRPGRF